VARHKVHFFGIETLQRDIKNQPGIFETVCAEILARPVAEKSLELDSSVSLRLNYFKKTNDYYEGKLVKYRTNHMMTGNVDDDTLTDFRLEGGKKFTEVTHFIYAPETGILSFEYNHNGPRHAMFMRYLNAVQTRYRADTVQFVADLLMHPDVVQKLHEAKRIKSLTIGLPVSKIPTELDRNNLLKGLSAAAQFGNPGQVFVTLAGPRVKGDQTPLISLEGLMSSLDSRYIDLDLFGKVDVDIATEFGSEVVNLLENKLEAFKDWRVDITSETAPRWFGDIRELYQHNKSLLVRALGALHE
jgi:hypothetical protein